MLHAAKIFAVVLAILAGITVRASSDELFFAAEDAVALGDWGNAEGLLSRYLSGADSTGRNYRNAMFELIKVKLELGKTAEARGMLDALTAGALPEERTKIDFAKGFLLAATGDSLGAIGAFENLVRTEGARISAIIALSKVYEQQKDFDSASRALNRVNIEVDSFNNPRSKAEFIVARILANLLNGNVSAAELDLEKYSAFLDEHNLARERKKLELLLLATGGKYLEYRRQSRELHKILPLRPDRILYYAATAAADEREKGKNYDDAYEPLRNAFKFGVSEEQRRNAMLRLINVNIKNGDRDGAAQVIEEFLRFFPDQKYLSPIIMAGARLRFRSGDYAAAADLYKRIVDDPGMSTQERIDAAREAAAAYQKLDRAEDAVKMYIFIQEFGSTPDARQEGNYLLGRHNFDNRNYRNAIEYFGRSSASAVWHDSSLFWLIQSYLELRDYSGAQRIADALSRSQDSKFAARGIYFRALAQRKANLFEGALQDYLAYIAIDPKGEFAAQSSLDAAECALESKQYQKALDLYLTFAESNQDSQYAPNALYKALFAGFMTGAATPEELQKLVSKLKDRYPDSPYTVNAILHNVDIFRTSGMYNAALDALAELEKVNRNRNVVLSAQILYERARVLAGEGQQLKALQVLEQMQNSYPGDLRCAEGYLLAGDVASEIGEYNRALSQYDKALELRPTGAFAFNARERRADALYSLYSTTLTLRYLEMAAAEFEKLSRDETRALSVRSGSIYKLGKSRELLGDVKGALQSYNDLIYFSSQAKRRGEDFSPFWCGKSVYAVIRAYMNIGGEAAARESLRVINLAEELQLPGVDFSQLKSEISKKYKL